MKSLYAILWLMISATTIYWNEFIYLINCRKQQLICRKQWDSKYTAKFKVVVYFRFTSIHMFNLLIQMLILFEL